MIVITMTMSMDYLHIGDMWQDDFENSTLRNRLDENRMQNSSKSAF